MPHYPVLQPDGKIAVWSTIVDSFTAFDCDQAEAVSELAQWHKGNLADVTARVANGEIPFDHWQDWADCAAWATFVHGADDATVQQAMERTPDAMMRRYLKQFVMTCKTEGTVYDLRVELATMTDRAEVAGAERDDLRRYANDADQATTERIARIDQLEAALAAATARAEAAGREQARLEKEIIETIADCNSNAANAYTAIKRAEAAEAALAAVPVVEIRTVLRAATDAYGMARERTDVMIAEAWLALQEVQP